MSWGKNTINLSNLDAVKEVLDDLNQFYVFTVLGEVSGFGLNDSDYVKHKICSLEYGMWIILEKIVKTSDCDSNDAIVSYKFKKDEVPEQWEIEEVVD